jgi:hypothetical protein
MHTFLAAAQGEVFDKLSRVPSRAQHRRGFFVMCPAQ